MLLFDDLFLKEHTIVSTGYTEVAEISASTEVMFNKWLLSGRVGNLKYLNDKTRSYTLKNIKNYFPEFQSALVFLFSYRKFKVVYDNFFLKKKNKVNIASFALAFEGYDYHIYLKSKLQMLAFNLIDRGYLSSKCEYKISLDASPVMEKDLAYRAGLGFFGKNSLLINPQHGSYVIIGTLLLSEKINDCNNKNKKQSKDCGDCRLCIDACPVRAIDVDNNKLIDARKCISALTIEKTVITKKITAEAIAGNDSSIFGCEICQQVCPYNHNKIDVETDFNFYYNKYPKIKLITDWFLNEDSKKNIDKLQNLSVREFKKIFKDTSFERVGKEGVIRNLRRHHFDYL
ncbi:MAG: 4Fe-4S dicluster domain-containing protein [Oligoflexia bacterium]|nr:4Fe-4S dicluster domain-containing protein [Oligoflexia bacterium]